MYNKLGISNSITRFLIRRGRGDTYLCLFLGLLTIVIIYYTYFYIKPRMKNAVSDIILGNSETNSTEI